MTWEYVVAWARLWRWGRKKDWGGMENCYNFEGNGGVVLEIDSGIEIPMSSKKVGCEVVF